MKSYFFTFISTLLFLASTFTASFAQTNWTKDPNNPVLTQGPLATWENFGVYAPFVLKHGDTLKMWYSGAKSGDVHQIGYAISFDGINWQRHPNNPVLNVGALGSWDAKFVSHPKVILDDTTYHMWYGGTDDPNGYSYRIGYATSTDGINWTKADSVNPVLPLGDPGEWDSASLAGHSYFFDGDTFHVWYAGSDGPNWSNALIGYAKSPDGINWAKHPNNPIFYGSSGSWDDIRVYVPCVIVDISGYKMWYQGYDGSYWRIGYATSLNGINWVALDSYVLDVGDPGRWDDLFAVHPHVLLDDSTYYMWYAGGRANTGWRIGYATAPIDPNSININDYKYIPQRFVLSQNYPNPFNPSTTIEFSIPKTEFVTLKIYNLLGQEVAALVSDKLTPGSYKYTWDASGFASGVYYYKIEAGTYVQTRKLILIK